jgi:hypothetical protein
MTRQWVLVAGEEMALVKGFAQPIRLRRIAPVAR